LRDLMVNKSNNMESKAPTGAAGKEKEDPEGKPGSATEPLEITLRGLQSMHHPSKTSVLYTSPVDADRRLHSFCCSLKSAFAKADLLVEDNRPLLLHATLVNTVYVPGVKRKGSGHGRSKAKLTIDARGIMKIYEGTEWMKGFRVEKVAICRMGAVKVEDGEEAYGVEGEVEMPI